MGFGKAVDRDRPLLHARQRRDRYMGFLSVSQLGIDLITEHEQVMLFYNLCDRLKILSTHNRAGRIVRERKHQKLRLWRDRSFKFLSRQAEFILRL